MMHNDVEKRVIEIVTNTINELQMIGVTSDGAARLLLIQAAIRMKDAAAIRATLGDMLDRFRRPGGTIECFQASESSVSAQSPCHNPG